ncbi:MAG: hypothetical protein QM778_12110 [Myxococcales bacterium]
MLAFSSACHGGELGGNYDLRCLRSSDCRADSDPLDLDADVAPDGANGQHAGDGGEPPDGDTPDRGDGDGDAMNSGALPDAGDNAAGDAGKDAGDELPYVWPELPDGGLLESLIEYVAPRVVFVDQTPRIRVFGTLLLSGDGFPVYVDDKIQGAFKAIDDSEGWFQLSSKLAEGEHFVQVGARAGAQRPGARLVAAKRMQYENADVTITQPPRSLVYAPEHRAFFFVFYTDATDYVLARLRFDGVRWRYDELDVPKPISIAVAADGRELLVLNANAAILHVDPAAFTLTSTELISSTSIYGTSFGEIYALADGQVLLRDRDALREYPSLDAMQVIYASTPTGYLSQDQTRLLWADSDQQSNAGKVYSYEAGASHAFTQARFLGGANNGVSISGDGRRASQAGDIYDGDLNYEAALAGAGSTGSVVLSGNGQIALGYNWSQKALQTYDLSGSVHPFPALGQPLQLFKDNNGNLLQMMLDENGSTAFLFSYHYTTVGPSQTDFYFQVRKLPAP